MKGTPSIFISYSHADKELARALASALEERGLRVWIDEGELKVGDSIIERIATAINEIDFFLALVSEASRDSNWCRKELALAVTGELGREGVKVLPVRVESAQMPDSLRDVFRLDIHSKNVAEVANQVAVAIPKHQEEQKARVARRDSRNVAASSTKQPPTPGSSEPIRIVGIVEEGIGKPKMDGTRGSALYSIPLRLTRRPPAVWAQLFSETWNHPPSWTTLHRPGIASVVGDTIVLDGTTMEELERHHLNTLRLVIEKLNAEVAQIDEKERQSAERDDQQLREHEESVRQVASRLKFD